MPRDRKHAVGPKDRKSDPRKSAKKKSSAMKSWHALVYGSFATVIVAVGFYFYFNYYMENLVITPLNVPKVVSDVYDSKLKHWGSYRSGVYFGMKTRHPKSPVMGLMWFAQEIVGNQLNIRHTCEQGDGLNRYAWLEHDGINFGLQEIVDHNYMLTTSFVKTATNSSSGGWTARITADFMNPKAKPLSLLFYVALDEDGILQPTVSSSAMHYITGTTAATGPFKLRLSYDNIKVLSAHHLSTYSPGLHVLKDVVLRNLAFFGPPDQPDKRLIGLVDSSKNKEGKPSNFVAMQVTFSTPFVLEVIYEPQDSTANILFGEEYSAKLLEHRKSFDEKFENIFSLNKLGFDSDHIKFGKMVLSNMLGGIGYFYGASIVQGPYNKQPIKYWDAPLYSGVPSRSFFPRGFLWDEGFHNLLIYKWDSFITEEIIAHWMDLMNSQGWIPREQILGDEARSKVPAEFVVQRDSNANPPTFFLTLTELLEHKKSNDIEWVNFVRKLFPRLKVWFHWYNSTQLGKLPGTYRWRGRNTHAVHELNPKTLTSGLDDYPRASHPSDDERHLDLRCWIAMAAKVMAKLATYTGEPSEGYFSTFVHLIDNKLLDSAHWSEELGMYADYGLHTDRVRLERPVNPPGSPVVQNDKIRVTDSEPKLQFVNAFGYASLFPLLLRILEPNSPKLGKLLTDIRKPDLLWTNFGLRSLAKNSPLYMKYNTEHDPPYWRGPIWININYLAVSALGHYSNLEGPYKEQARKIRDELKNNLVSNMLKEYNKSGYIWETYNDMTGKGKGSHPFTGWSALILRIMAER